MADRHIPFVGLTGGIASGKSIASAEFASLGVPIVDADDVGHDLLNSASRAVAQIARDFGTEFVAPDGSADRTALRSAVFSDDAVRHRLEALLHPLIEKECRRRMKRCEGVFGMLVAPLMFETDFMLEELDRVLLIEVDPTVQLRRGIQRGKFTEQQLKSAIAAQMKPADRRRCADDIIVNNGSPDLLRKAVRSQHQTYAEMFAAG